MDERVRESLSALMDDEANELELERVLSQISGDVEMRQTWVRYNAARSLVSGQSVASLSLDISAQVREAIALETQPVDSSVSPLQRLLRPLASFAVAASVATVVVIGGQQLSDVGNGQSLPTTAMPVGVGYSAGATPVRASYGTQAVPTLQRADGTAYRELARLRMQQYMQEHAEHAALNSPQGLIPFARVPQIVK